MPKISTHCIYCGFVVISEESWLLSNHLLFCDTCCKSFSPKHYTVLKEEDEEDFFSYKEMMDDDKDFTD